MDKVKAEHFKVLHPNRPPLAVRPLSTHELERLRMRFRKVLGTEETASGVDLVRLVDALTVPLHGVKATSSDFRFKRLAEDLRVSPRPSVYVNWRHLDDVDELSYSDLTEYFSSIWFPGSDDIEVFDDTLSWIIAVDHEGYAAGAVLRPHGELG